MSAAHAGVTTLATLVILGGIAVMASRRLRVRLQWRHATSLLVAIVTTLVAILFAQRLSNARAIFLAASVINSVTDWQTGFIFDYVLASSTAAIVLVTRDSWSHEAIGAAAAVGIASIPYALSRGRGMGVADIKYAGVIGLVLGTNGAAKAMYVAYVSAGVAAICLLMRRRASRNSAIAFGPFLSFGAIWTMLVGA